MSHAPAQPGDQAWVSVLREDPELGEGLAAVELPAARRAAAAGVSWVEKGAWQPGQTGPRERGSLGVLVLGGLLLRRVTVRGAPCAERLGPGDPDALGADRTEPFSAGARWEVLEPACVAVLDRRFTALLKRWPEITVALVGRAVLRSRALARSSRSVGSSASSCACSRSSGTSDGDGAPASATRSCCPCT